MRILFSAVCVFVVAYAPANADIATIQTPAPVIHLIDNLDEQDGLGWCIDTVGRGFSDRLHAHSCKPQGGDVQFSFDVETGLVQSVAFPGNCMAVTTGGATALGLLPCDRTSSDQQFRFAASTGEIGPVQQEGVCVVVSSASRSAGPFMSRSLELAACDGAEDVLKTWKAVAQ